MIKTKDELNEYYFLTNKICFHNLCFGGCLRTFYGATPTEILNVLLLVLCDYIAEGVENTFTVSRLNLIYHVVVGIYEDARR